MSKVEIDRDGFQIVKSKRNSKHKQTKIPANDLSFQKEEINIDIDKAIGRINSAVEDLVQSNYLVDACKSVTTILDLRKVTEIVCFGLGHIAECNISKYQLALLLCLKNLCEPEKVLVHDPIFYKDECTVLKKLGLEVIEKNHEGSYVISDKGVTIVYFPHCPKQLTNNFLWSNWGLSLSNCILVCNSISSLINNHPNRTLSETVPYIYKISSYACEIALENNFKFTDIFNDTSLHYFPKENLINLDKRFWEQTEKPSYKNTEEFITSLMIEKLNI